MKSISIIQRITASFGVLILLLILLALIARGVSFEYRHQRDDIRWKRRFDWMITIGSAVPALLWGVAVGNIVQGVPIDADMVFDVRFLPNPHWVPDLRPQTGLSQAVSSYVLGHAEALAFLDHATELLAVVKPGYVREGKRLATIAIGCTGGKHRSTAMAVELARRLRAVGIASQVLHRDLGKE